MLFVSLSAWRKLTIFARILGRIQKTIGPNKFDQEKEKVNLFDTNYPGVLVYVLTLKRICLSGDGVYVHGLHHYSFFSSRFSSSPLLGVQYR